MEQGFQQDLSGVSAHIGDRAAADGLGNLGAAAATWGDQVAFRSPSPSLALVAHEVAHVVQSRVGRSAGEAEVEADRAAGLVAAGQQAEVRVQASAGPYLTPGDPFPGTIIMKLKAIDPGGVAPAAAQVMGAVRDLSIFITGCQREAMFEGGPNKHEWWNLWGAIGTSEKQKTAEGLLEMAAKASEFATALAELGSGMTSIAGQVQAWTSSLPDVAPAETRPVSWPKSSSMLGKCLAG
jgi:hypothetical protein